MISLLLGICSSAMVAIVMRLSQSRTNNPTGLLAANYIVCCFMALALSLPTLGKIGADTLPLPVGLGGINGFLYLGSFLLMQWNTRHNGVVLSSVFMKLGILVPTILSVVWFREIPTPVQITGFALAIAAILVLNVQKGTRLSSKSWALLLMLLVGGLGDGTSKIYEVYGNAYFQNLFLFFTFFSALLLCLGMVAYRKERVGFRELTLGIALGVPNFLSSLFLLKALDTIPAVIAFPTYSVAVIMVVAVAGVFFFRERLSKKQMIGCLLICIALALLNL